MYFVCSGMCDTSEFDKYNKYNIETDSQLCALILIFFFWKDFKNKYSFQKWYTLGTTEVYIQFRISVK